MHCLPGTEYGKPTQYPHKRQMFGAATVSHLDYNQMS